jgi:hypothetical protein
MNSYSSGKSSKELNLVKLTSFACIIYLFPTNSYLLRYFIYSLAEFELYFWIGGNALSYMSDVNGRDVPADKWRWVGSGRQIDLPKEAWGENQPNRGFHDDTKCYEACIALDGESTDIHDLHCNQRFPVICQKIEYN